jgi:hypothetical protein
MGLRIFNQHSAEVSTAIMFFNPDTCGGEGQDFEVMGWWNIAPAGNALVYANDVDFNRYWFAFAMAKDGRRWTGPWRHSLPSTAFAMRCWGLGSTSDTIDGEFFRFDVGDNEDYNLRLTT